MRYCFSFHVVSAGAYAGGLVGYNDGSTSTISNCHSRGNVSGSHDVGGLVGTNLGSVKNCYSIDTISGNYHIGALIGRNEGKVINSICEDDGLPMDDIWTYLNMGWDFVGETKNGLHEIWQMREDEYPVLSFLIGYIPPRLLGQGTPNPDEPEPKRVG